MLLSTLAGLVRPTTRKLFVGALTLVLHATATPAGAAEAVYVPVKADPTIIDNSVADTYDPAAGAYNVATNRGPAPQFVQVSTTFNFQVPTNLGPKVTEFKLSGHGTTVLQNSIHCDKFILETHRVVMIRGDVTIVADEEFKVQNQAKLRLEPGATLTVFTKKVFTLQDRAVLNDDTARPNGVKVVHLAPTDNLILQNQCVMAAKVFVPSAQIQIQDGSHYYGQFYGHSVYLKNSGQGHFVSSSWTRRAAD